MAGIVRMTSRQRETFPPVTLGHIRSHGCRDLLVYCESTWCHHGAIINADRLPDETAVRSLCSRMVCTRCGLIGADVRPDWSPHTNHRAPEDLGEGAMIRVHPLLRLVIQAVLLGVCVVAGYLIAERWWATRDSTALAQICARIDYVNGLQEELQGQLGSTQEVRDEFMALVEQCRTALRSRAEEND